MYLLVVQCRLHVIQWLFCFRTFFNLTKFYTLIIFWRKTNFFVSVYHFLLNHLTNIECWNNHWIRIRGRRGRNRKLVGFTTTYAIRAYHHWCCGFESRSGWGVQHYEIKFISGLRQVGGFLRSCCFLHQ